MTDRGYEEAKSDAHALAVRLRLAVDAEDWLAVNRLCERLQEASHNLYHEEHRRAGLARMKNLQPFCQE